MGNILANCLPQQGEYPQEENETLNENTNFSAKSDVNRNNLVKNDSAWEEIDDNFSEDEVKPKPTVSSSQGKSFSSNSSSTNSFPSSNLPPRPPQNNPIRSVSTTSTISPSTSSDSGYDDFNEKPKPSFTSNLNSNSNSTSTSSLAGIPKSVSKDRISLTNSNSNLNTNRLSNSQNNNTTTTVVKEEVKKEEEDDDFFSDMAPVYKAPKKMEYVKKVEPIEKSSRLNIDSKPSQSNSSNLLDIGDDDISGGWDVVIEESPQNTESNTSAKKQTQPRKEKEVKPKAQAVKVDLNFDESSSDGF